LLFILTCFKAIEVKNLEERKKLTVLVEEFYKERIVPDEIRITICPLALGWSRLENQGVDLQPIEENKENYRKRLQKFQNEMGEFVTFLKGKFFQE
jgi:hypothetical protein